MDLKQATEAIDPDPDNTQRETEYFRGEEAVDYIEPVDPPQITVETSMRMTALHLAIEFCGDGNTAEDAVDIAGAFLAFLRGGIPTPPEH